MALKGFISRLRGRSSFEALYVQSGPSVNDKGFAIYSFYGAPTNGAAGTKANQAPPGSLLVDTQNFKLYINTNTQASPTWTVVGSQS